jgi:PrtD family type I secretion system ABC transporter
MAKTSKHSASNDQLAMIRRSCRGATMVVFLLSVVVNLSMLTLPLYTMQLFDRVLSSGNQNTLLFLAMIAAFFLVLSGVLDFARSGIQLRIGQRCAVTLREQVFKACFANGASTNLAQQAMADTRAATEVMTAGVLATIFDLIWTPFFVLLCYVIHPVLGHVALASVVVLFLLAVINERITSGRLASANAAHAEASGHLNAAFDGREAARGLGMGSALEERWTASLTACDRDSMIANERAAAIQSMTKTSRLLVQAALMSAAAWLAIQQEISASVIIASSIIMGRALAPVEQIVGHWKRIIAYRGASQRLSVLLATTDQVAHRTDLPRPSGELEVSGLAVAPTRGSRPVIAGIAFKLEAGQSLAIVGASGSGKSTLARSLVGALPVKAGEIRLDHATLDQWMPDTLGQHLGYVPQSVSLLEGTIAENIARFTEATSETIIAAAKEAGVHEAILRLPDGYQTQLGPNGTGLSGGMQQRVALARAVFANPCLVVLDEPNANLDEEGERSLQQSIKRMTAAGRTVVAVTHRPHLLQVMDQLLVMNQGRQVAFGPRDEVVQQMRGNRVAAVR